MFFDNFFELDLILLNFYTLIRNSGYSTAYKENFPSFSINFKRILVKDLYSHNKTTVKIENLPIIELRRFKKVYPITTSDLRVFRYYEISKLSQNIHLQIKSSKKIRICGLILGGSRYLKKINGKVMLKSANSDKLEIPFMFKCNEGYVFFEGPSSDYFDIHVEYPKDSQLFSGKLTSDTDVTHDGVTFKFFDEENKMGKFYGPILGILYSVVN